VIGILFVGIVYVAAVTIGILVVPQSTLAASDAPFVTILDHLISPGNGRWLSLFIVISGLGCLNGWTLLSAELTRTLAMHRLLPEILGRATATACPGRPAAGGCARDGRRAHELQLVARRCVHQAVADRVALRTCRCTYAVRSRSSTCCARARPACRRRCGSPASAASPSRVRVLRRRLGAVYLGARPVAAGVPIYFFMRRRHPDAVRPLRRPDRD
jgi:APA family basic amino acid/polyamine antiporter